MAEYLWGMLYLLYVVLFQFGVFYAVLGLVGLITGLALAFHWKPF